MTRYAPGARVELLDPRLRELLDLAQRSQTLGKAALEQQQAEVEAQLARRQRWFEDTLTTVLLQS